MPSVPPEVHDRRYISLATLKITGPEFPATVRILPAEEFPRVRRLISAKYWLARVPFLWRNTDIVLEITPASA